MCIPESGIRYIREMRKKVYELIGENYEIADMITKSYERGFKHGSATSAGAISSLKTEKAILKKEIKELKKNKAKEIESKVEIEKTVAYNRGRAFLAKEILPLYIEKDERLMEILKGESGKIRCVICGKSFSSYDKLKEHEEEHAVKKKRTEEKYKVWEENRKEILRLYESGKTVKEIAELKGKSQTAIRHAIKLQKEKNQGKEVEK